MKCPHCQTLAADNDKVCYVCKKYIGNERASETIGGDTNYARLVPMCFVVFGVPAFHMLLPRFMPQLYRLDTYDSLRIFYSFLAFLVLLTVGSVLGRLIGDGRTVRI